MSDTFTSVFDDMTDDEIAQVRAKMAAHQRERFAAYLANVHAAQHVVQEVELPDFWEHPCPCMKPGEDGALDWNIESIQVVELGYARWENVDNVLPPGQTDIVGPGPAIHASTNGWGSMSEDGYIEYLECAVERGGCGAIWATPSELEWD